MFGFGAARVTRVITLVAPLGRNLQFRYVLFALSIGSAAPAVNVVRYIARTDTKRHWHRLLITTIGRLLVYYLVTQFGFFVSLNGPISACGLWRKYITGPR